VVSSRVNVEIVDRLVTSHSSVKIVRFQVTMVAITVTRLEEFSALIVVSRVGHVKQNCFRLKNNDARYNNNQAGDNNNGNRVLENYSSQDVVLATITKTEKFTDNIWI
jgi:hypothetical protein